jgi:spermidine synthase
MIITEKNTENGEVILREGPAGYEIIVDGQFLMSSASGNSSEALVEMGLAKLKPRSGLQVLIGGLGLGFSLKTALLDSAVAEVTVIELENQIIEWHRQGLIGNTKQLLRDPRVRILNRDFLQFSEEWSACANPKYDLIALDIDNGPDWLSHEANVQLYGEQVLKRLLRMLNHQGILTMWSAAPSTLLEQSLQQVFGNVMVEEAADHNGEGKVIMAYIYICQSR